MDPSLAASFSFVVPPAPFSGFLPGWSACPQEGAGAGNFELRMGSCCMKGISLLLLAVAGLFLF